MMKTAKKIVVDTRRSLNCGVPLSPRNMRRARVDLKPLKPVVTRIVTGTRVFRVLARETSSAES